MSNNQAAARKKALKELLIGGAVAIVGVVASVASYNMAKVGETYTVYTGVIVVGAVYALKGLFGLAFPSGFKKVSKSAEPAVVEEEDPAKPAEA